MAGRNPARFLAPIALVAFAFALYQVVQGAREPANKDSGTPASATATATATKKSTKKSTKRATKTYTVKPGDTPTGIAEKTGVPYETLLELNQDLDPQSLQPGERIRLSE